jgi:hypothetical protein
MMTYPIFRLVSHAGLGAKSDVDRTAETRRTQRFFIVLRVLCVSVVISVVISVFLAPHAQAENLGPGGGTRVIVGDEIVGPYRLLFTSSPEPAQVGKVTFDVRLSDPKTDEKVRDAEVVVDLKHSETGATLSQAATHADAGNPTDYVAHLQLDQPGQWEGVLRVRGPAGSAELPFMQRVTPKRQLSTLVIAGAPFLVVLALLAGLWFARSGSRQKR